jgi:hypothetical protein
MDRIDKDPEYRHQLCQNFINKGKTGNLKLPVE